MLDKTLSELLNDCWIKDEGSFDRALDRIEALSHRISLNSLFEEDFNF